MTTTHTPPTCGAAGGMTKAGAPCRTSMNLSADSGLCVQHDPARAVARAAMQAAGGAASKVAKTKAKAAEVHDIPKAPKNLEDAVHWSSWAMHAVASRTMDARTGHEVGYLVNAFKAAVEKRDLLREIEQLRRDLAEARKDTPKSALELHRG